EDRVALELGAPVAVLVLDRKEIALRGFDRAGDLPRALRLRSALRRGDLVANGHVSLFPDAERRRAVSAAGLSAPRSYGTSARGRSPRSERSSARAFASASEAFASSSSASA